MTQPAVLSTHQTNTQQAASPPPCTGFRNSVYVGLGLRSRHYEDILNAPPANIGWLEVHPENYFGGGLNKYYLDHIAALYPISLHGVGLSLGSDQPVDQNHIKQFKQLIDRYNPIMVSDHIAWSASGNAHLNDLLPLPYTHETLRRLRDNINQVQDSFGRRILVENPSTYIAFKDNDMSEQDFMNEICAATGCAMLLDINNIFVQSHNHNLDPVRYIMDIDPSHVQEMHLAGHIEKPVGEHSLLIDTHNQEVCEEVWKLYKRAVTKFGKTPTLIEWDQDVPELSILLNEADRAGKILRQACTSNQERLG